MQLPQAIDAIILAAFVSFISYRLKLLSRSGGWAALGVGFCVFGFGGLSGAVPLIVFFVTSNLLGRWRSSKKKRLSFDKGAIRDWAQVLANSAAATVALTIASTLTRFHVAGSTSRILYVCFAAGIAEAAADTWATEIGAASNEQPRLITTLQKVTPGRSGAVTLTGTLAALGGAATIAACAYPFVRSVPSGLCIMLAGLFGALLDSLLGASVQALYVHEDGRRGDIKRQGNRLERGIAFIDNDIVNFLSTVAAMACAAAIMRV